MKHIIGEGYCHACDKNVLVRREDWGIGAYEFWGQKAYDHQWTFVCDECEEEIDGDFDEYYSFEEREKE